MKKIDEDGHKLLAIWAAECAEHVLSFFEKNHPDDVRPRKAIEAARAWVLGELKMSKAREFAFAAHAAATAHVPGHAIYSASYAVKASINPKTERDWQMNFQNTSKVKVLFSFHLTSLCHWN